MLNDSRVEANIPVGDIERVKVFYVDKFGLTPLAEMVPGYV